MTIEPFKVRVIQVALRAAHGHGFALAGGNALVAHDLLERLTDDVDLFSPAPGGAGRVLAAVCAELVANGFEVEVLRSAADGDFAELQVSCNGQSTHVDLARDWRAHDSVILDVGPVLHLDDAVGAKVTALLGRALPRDFIDVAAAMDRYARVRLLELAFDRDRGLRIHDAALAAQALDRLETAQFLRYGLTPTDVDTLRARFVGWPRDSTNDQEAHAVHAAVHRP